MANENTTNNSTETTVETKVTESQSTENNATVEELKAQLAAERAEKERHKTALDKALKEKGDITKQLRAKQTAEEQQAEELAEAQNSKNLVTPFAISKDFSLVMALIVSLSLQLTFGKIGVPKYSPIKASMCFLTIGVNLTEVGLPIPKFSSRYLNCSSSRSPA